MNYRAFIASTFVALSTSPSVGWAAEAATPELTTINLAGHEVPVVKGGRGGAKSTIKGKLNDVVFRGGGN